MKANHTESMKLALEGAANYIDALGGDSRKYRQALAEQPAQSQQEPVAIALNTGTKQGVKWLKNIEHGEHLYTSPPAQRKPLTDEEITAIEEGIWKPEFFDDTERQANREFARAIEAAHGIKENT